MQYAFSYKNGYLIYDREKNKIKFTSELCNEIDEGNTSYNNFNNELKDIDNKDSIKTVKITYLSTPYCNLNCKYCYEHNKLSHSKLRIMSANEHYNIFDSIKGYFPDEAKIKICFFGGEPFLAKEQIFDFVKMLEYDCEKHKTELPCLSAITNGTILNSEERKFVYDYFNAITFSLDGTKILHDANRIYKNGAGSFDDVVNNIVEFNKLNFDKRVYTACEVTLTDAYFENYSHKLMEEVWGLLKKLKFREVALVPVIDENTELINKIENIDLIAKDIVDLWYEDVINNSCNIKVPYLIDYLSLLVANKSIEDSICGAGYNSFVVDSNYNVYPCQTSIFMENKENSIIGEISNSKLKFNEFQTTKYLTKKEHPLCKKCECMKGCNTFCKIVMNDEFENMPLGCLFNKKIFEHFLTKIVNIMNSDQKENFINGVKLLFSN